MDGGFALEQGFIYSAMILAAMTVHILKRQFTKAAMWSFSAAVLSALGLMHSWQFTPGDTVVYIPLLEQLSTDGAPATLAELVPAWEYALAYGIVAVLGRRGPSDPGDAAARRPRETVVAFDPAPPTDEPEVEAARAPRDDGRDPERRPRRRGRRRSPRGF